MQIYSLLFCFVAQSVWIQFSDVYNTFSIEVPNPPEMSSDRFAFSLGEVEVITYKCKGSTEDKNLMYVLQEFDYPDNFIHGDSISLMQELLLASIEESATKLSGDIDYKNEIFLSGNPGMLYRVSYNHRKNMMKCKSYIIDGTFYSLQVYCKVSNSLNDEMDKFLDSFILK